MTTEFNNQRTVSLNTFVRSFHEVSSFLGIDELEYLRSIGKGNKKIEALIRVKQSGTLQEDINNSEKALLDLERLGVKSIKEDLTKDERRIDQIIRNNLKEIFLKTKSKTNSQQAIELLVNLLIPRDKWIGLNSSNLQKILSFYHTKTLSLVTTEKFEKFICFNKNFHKFKSLFSSDLTQYYEERMLKSGYTRIQLKYALMIRSKLE